MKKNIFIIGSVGYEKNYGGWETFVKNFCDFYDKNKANIYVAEITQDKYLNEYKKNEITSNPIYTKRCGSATMPIYSVKSLYYYIDYIKINNLKNCIFLILGLKVGPFLNILKKKLKKLNIKVYVNPDGLEWKRSKWNKLVKKYFKYAEKTMLSNCDGIICDSRGIKDYLEDEYKNNIIPKYYIAYGQSNVDISKTDEIKILDDYNLKKNEYCLYVGRCVPENNIELIINEFRKSNINKSLVIISNTNGNKYYDTIISNTKCENDKRVIFIPGVYDKEKLTVIRKNAYLYLHGHSVGGTNPSLLEAMNVTDLNILYDVNFNREVGKNSCLYFTDESNNLMNILNNKKLLEKCKKEYGIIAKKIISDNYTWNIIVKRYEKLFK